MPEPPATGPRIHEVYIDESSHAGHRYLVLGGIIVETRDVEEACAAIWKARIPELPAGILKWTKVSRTKLPAYKRAVDAFLQLAQRDIAHFHCLVVDTTRQKHHLYNQGSRDIGFNKEVYQLALKFGRLYRALFHIYPDRRTTNQTTEDLRLMLNRGIKQYPGENRDWPYRRVQFREPEDNVILQLSDVLAGSIAFMLNEHHLKPNASRAKKGLSQHILSAADITDVTRDTAISGRFTIWHRRLR